MKIQASQTVRAVMELYPQTVPVFVRHGLDACCGGMHPIEQAAAARGASLPELLAELNAAVG